MEIANAQKAKALYRCVVVAAFKTIIFLGAISPGTDCIECKSTDENVCKIRLLHAFTTFLVCFDYCSIIARWCQAK